MEKKILLTSEEIVNKSFAKESHGYSIQEVNHFLDVIANDYDQFEEVANNLKKTIFEQKTRIKELESDFTNVSIVKKTMESELLQLKKGGLTDFGSVLKRITQLEESDNKILQAINKLSEKLEK